MNCIQTNVTACKLKEPYLEVFVVTQVLRKLHLIFHLRLFKTRLVCSESESKKGILVCTGPSFINQINCRVLITLTWHRLSQTLQVWVKTTLKFRISIISFYHLHKNYTQLQVRLIIVDLIRFIYCCRVPGSKPEYKDIGFLHFAILHKGMSSKIELILKMFFCYVSS